jgi:hypothetical protein
MSEQPDEAPVVNDFERDLAEVLNKHSMDNGSNTPDYILARYLIRCLDNFREVNQERESWFGTPLRINNDSTSQA